MEEKKNMDSDDIARSLYDVLRDNGCLVTSSIEGQLSLYRYQEILYFFYVCFRSKVVYFSDNADSVCAYFTGFIEGFRYGKREDP